MTLVEMCTDVSQKTGLDPAVIEEMAGQQWAMHKEFSRTQSDLLVYLIDLNRARNKENGELFVSSHCKKKTHYNCFSLKCVCACHRR